LLNWRSRTRMVLWSVSEWLEWWFDRIIPKKSRKVPVFEFTQIVFKKLVYFSRWQIDWLKNEFLNEDSARITVWFEWENHFRVCDDEFSPSFDRIHNLLPNNGDFTQFQDSFPQLIVKFDHTIDTFHHDWVQFLQEFQFCPQSREFHRLTLPSTSLSQRLWIWGKRNGKGRIQRQDDRKVTDLHKSPLLFNFTCRQSVRKNGGIFPDHSKSAETPPVQQAIQSP
jgi:hypothetical protein